MEFKEWLNEAMSLQDDMAFLRKYFEDGMNPDNLLIWADFLEEAGEDKKAHSIRQKAKGYTAWLAYQEPIREMMGNGWEKGAWHAYHKSPQNYTALDMPPPKNLVYCDKQRLSKGENYVMLRLNTSTKEWQKLETVRWEPIDVNQIPDEALREVFIYLMVYDPKDILA